MKHIPRLYVQGPFKKGQDIFLTDHHAHHLKNVMRAKAGMSVFLFNEEDGEWSGEITRLDKRDCIVALNQQVKKPATTPDIHLIFSPLKNNRTDFILEKGTELGVTHFWPTLFERTDVRKFRADKAELFCMQAAQQCGRMDIPKIHALDKLYDQIPDRIPCLFCDENAKSSSWGELKSPIAIIIGPEGGISDKERTWLQSKSHVRPISLGSTILRAETAAIVALSGVRITLIQI